MSDNLIGVLILEAPATDHAIRYWQSWFASKSISCSTRELPDGTALYRGMTRDEYERYKKL